MNEEDVKRFLDKVQVGSDDECWLWIGAIYNGRGIISYAGKTMLATRFAWLWGIGENLPSRVYHVCGNKLCCNPKHLTSIEPSKYENPIWDRCKNNYTSGCWEWQGACNANGYGVVSIKEFGRGSKLAHRIAWQMTHGEIPEGMCVCHHCDNRICCNPSHLFLGTYKDNNQDKVAKGRGNTLYGEASPRSILTSQDVIAIRNSVHSTAKELACKYGITYLYVYAIKKGTTWKHLL